VQRDKKRSASGYHSTRELEKANFSAFSVFQAPRLTLRGFLFLSVAMAQSLLVAAALIE
jgi:hypothetical protein